MITPFTTEQLPDADLLHFIASYASHEILLTVLMPHDCYNPTA